MTPRVLTAFALLTICCPKARAQPQAFIDFPGGSGVVHVQAGEETTIRIDPSNHPGKGFRAWWYVKLAGLTPGKTVVLDVGEAPWATPDQAMFSTDNADWKQTEPGVRTGKRIRYRLVPPAGTLWVAWGPPFVLADAQRLVESTGGRAGAEVFNLCETREGNATPAVRIMEKVDSEPSSRPLLWVHARQHAWESGASWVCKGFVDWVCSSDAAATRLRQSAEIVVVPIMDVDNVQRGAGGKNQIPHDHNRDWSDSPHWRAVAEAQSALRKAAQEGRLAAFIDLHNPSANDKSPFFFIPPAEVLSPQGRENLARFISIARQEMTGPLAFKGKTVESGAQYDPKAWRQISKNWVACLGTPAISVTLETSWNTPESTIAGYETIGAQLGKAVSRYMREQ